MSLSPEIIAAAQESQRETNVWASVEIAQFGIESAWGTKMPAGSNNPFGIKAVAGQPYVEARTREVINGQSVYVTARFAKYANFAEAFKAHAKLLSTSHYYAEAMKHAYRSADPSAERFIDGLGAYATDPSYRSTLKGLCRQLHLYQYDTLPETVPSTPTPEKPVDPTPVPAPVPGPNLGGFLPILLQLFEAFGKGVATVIVDRLLGGKLPISLPVTLPTPVVPASTVPTPQIGDLIELFNRVDTALKQGKTE